MLDQLSRLPWLPLPRGVARCRVQPIRVEDLAEGLVAALDQPAGSWTAVGPEVATVADWIARRRAAQGLTPARVVELPDVWARASARLGDLLPISPWGRTALDLLAHDSIEPAVASPLPRPLRPVLSGSWA
jgi:uncharacterized protein YbjT (DUF2867 family)